MDLHNCPKCGSRSWYFDQRCGHFLCANQSCNHSKKPEALDADTKLRELRETVKGWKDTAVKGNGDYYVGLYGAYQDVVVEIDRMLGGNVASDNQTIRHPMLLCQSLAIGYQLAKRGPRSDLTAAELDSAYDSANNALVEFEVLKGEMRGNVATREKP